MTRWEMQTTLGLPASGQTILAARRMLWQRLLVAIGEGEPARAATILTTRHTLQGGEIGAFEPFFRAHERDIFTYLWRMTSDEQAAYDLAQETFLRAWQHFAKIRDYERPGGWLFRVATHLALNHLRSRATPLGAPASLDAVGGVHHGHDGLLISSAATSDPGARVAAADTVRRALIALSPRQRAALVLREVYGLPCGEVAAALGMSSGAAKTLLWRARDAFRACYAEEAR